MSFQRPDRKLDGLRAFARVLDSAIAVPGTKMRFGLDPVLGLIPGFGDLAGAAMSGYIVLAGIRNGASRVLIMRMLGNVAIDTLVGSVPILGDLFDAGWKSNMRNVTLLEQHLDQPHATERGSLMLVVAVAVVLLMLALAGAALTFLVLRALVRVVS